MPMPPQFGFGLFDNNAGRGSAMDGNPGIGGLWRAFGTAGGKGKKGKESKTRHVKPVGWEQGVQPRSGQRLFPACHLRPHLIRRGSAIGHPAADRIFDAQHGIDLLRDASMG